MSGDVTIAGLLPGPNWSMWTRPLDPTKPHPATDLGHAGMWRVEDDKFVCYTGKEVKEVPVSEIPGGLVRLLPDMPLHTPIAERDFSASGKRSAAKVSETKVEIEGTAKSLVKQFGVRSVRNPEMVLAKDDEDQARDFLREFDDYELVVRIVGQWEAAR